MQIFLAPRSNETSYKNFLSTIENGVDFSIVEPKLDKEGKKILGKYDKLFAWGNKETKKSSWDKMQPGDLILFYKGREGSEKEGKFIYSGRLLFKYHSKELGLALWPPKPGEEPWTCVFFLNELKPVYIPISDVIEFGGYSHNFVVQGFMPLNEDGIKKILDKFGTIDKFLQYYSVSEKEEKSDLESVSEVRAHSEAELLLLKVGKMSGYDTYSPDKSKEAFGEKLSDYITLDTIPKRFLGEELISLVQKIDVIWFKDEIPRFAFEVEHSTKFGNGFQRLSQLQPLPTKLFILSSGKNYYLFDKFVNSEPYYKYKEKFHFRDYKQLESYFNAVSKLSTINETFLN
ncbi:hypothetical protein ACFLZS_01595 [Patescibacteria group bacterium]